MGLCYIALELHFYPWFKVYVIKAYNPDKIICISAAVTGGGIGNKERHL